MSNFCFPAFNCWLHRECYQFGQEQYWDSQILIKTFDILKITKYSKIDYST